MDTDLMSDRGVQQLWKQVTYRAEEALHSCELKRELIGLITCVSTDSKMSIKKKQAVQNWGNGIRVVA